MLKKLTTLTLVVAVFSLVLALGKGEDRKPFELTIIHVNDNHANHEPQASGDGGDSRQAAVIRQIRADVRNHLTLDAGDRFTGTLFHTQYKGMDNVPFLNMLGFQAMAIGNHEFDEGDDGLATFIGKVNCPILAANVDVSRSRALNGKVKPYTVIKVSGEDIGIIGLATVDTKSGSKPSKDVTFEKDYAGIVQKFVDHLTKERINKIVVLSHIGLGEDLKLAGQTTGVDAIVGGHSHTLLSKTYREAKNTYPMKVNGKDGKPVYIVQAGGGDNRFVGRLDLEFDGEGNVTKAGGDTILLSKFITPDKQAQAEVDKLAGPINDLKKKKILDKNNMPVQMGMDFPADKVRDEETCLGNLYCDAMRAKAKTQIAIQGGGGLRATLNKGEITYGDVYKLLPFNNKLVTYKLKGSDMLATLEHGVSRYGESGNGRFLQLSGLRFAFAPDKPKGQRVSSVEIQLGALFEPLDPAKEYTIASDNYIQTGGDDYQVLVDKAFDVNEDLPPVLDVFVEYLQANSPVTARLEGRIRVLK
jgi:5'-nucleotidase / UDP-sugar diphosphatase